MRKRLLLLLMLVLGSLAVPATSQALLAGVADQHSAMFTNKYYTRLIARQPASHRISRYIAPYDVDDGSKKNIAFLRRRGGSSGARLGGHI